MNEQQILRICNEFLNFKSKFMRKEEGKIARCLEKKYPLSVTSGPQSIMSFDIVKTYILRL